MPGPCDLGQNSIQTEPHSDHSNRRCYLFGGFLLVLQVSGFDDSSTCGGHTVGLEEDSKSRA